MKTIILKIASLTFALSLTINVFSQEANIAQNFSTFENQYTSDISGLASFSYQVVEQKVFFNLSVKNLKEDCVFVIERSVNGEKFKSVALKMGRADNKDVNILYSFKDTLNFMSDKAEYRLKQVFETAGTFYSNSYSIKNDNYMYLADYKE